MTAYLKPRTGDRSWLSGASRTWRWNEGSYEQRGSYDAVEASPDGLVWYHWSHGYGEGGARDRLAQTFESFATDGPARPVPEALRDQLNTWLMERGHVAST